jgi:alanine-glyoxylate transaminase / serine-glyoxylate transaminase / serine-pyruvate transaminase
MEKFGMSEFNPTPRILMGPGPSNVPYRVYKAMTTPVIGYLDSQLLVCMDQISEMLRGLFQTKNRLTFALSATGGAGMETAFINFVEPGDTVIIGVKGFFGERMTEVAARTGVKIIRVDQEWGKAIEPEKMIKALKEHPEAKVCAIVHAETSTGVRQPLEEIGAFCKKTDTLFLVDAVTSLGACEVKVDGWGIDICYSCTQKGISVPPGMSPITVSPKALDVLRSRKTPVQSWYFDLSLIEKYWGQERVYHHTAPASMFYALREGLCLVFEEGLEARFRRHEMLGDRLKMELEGLGFKLFAQEGYRLPMLTSAYLPAGVDDAATRKRLTDDYGIEVGGGLGKVKGKIWRVGLMGETCRLQNIHALVAALKEIFA